MSDEIKCYTKNGVGSYFNDLDPDMNIGKMLRVYLKKGYFKEDISDVNLLCCDETTVIALKLNDKFYYFGNEQDDIYQILERTPTDTFWSQLTEEEVITISPEEILKKAEELNILKDKSRAAAKLIQENLKRTEKNVAIFTTENGKLALFPEYSIHNKVFVSDQMFEFDKIIEIISTPNYTS